MSHGDVCCTKCGGYRCRCNELERKEMRKIIVEDEKEGLIKLLGEEVTLFCANYFYTGKLIGVNKTCCLLENPSIIYETGAFTDANWKDAQSMNVKEWYVRLSAVESFGVA